VTFAWYVIGTSLPASRALVVVSAGWLARNVRVAS
jgi:hypothetical protein